jgi:alkaline phosphatase
MKNLFLSVFLFCAITVSAQKRELPSMHSHNDYQQNTPFWLAFTAGATSIEIDVIFQDEKLYVAHGLEEIHAERVIEKMYFDPLRDLRTNDHPVHQVKLLVDFKTEAYSTMKKLLEITGNYPALFNDSDSSLKLIISGNRPKQSDYSNYPSFILFDGRDPKEVSLAGGEKIGLISRNVNDFTRWRGFGEFPEADSIKLVSFISDCHAQNRKVRLWATKDNEQVYGKLIELGVDLINTDRPFQLRQFLDTYETENK